MSKILLGQNQPCQVSRGKILSSNWLIANACDVKAKSQFQIKFQILPF